MLFRSVEDAEGVPEGRDERNRVIQNIACWWLIEHYERVEGNSHVSFPGELAMPRGLMPLALWLGVRKYRGINHQRAMF